MHHTLFIAILVAQALAAARAIRTPRSWWIWSLLPTLSALIAVVTGMVSPIALLFLWGLLWLTRVNPVSASGTRPANSLSDARFALIAGLSCFMAVAPDAWMITARVAVFSDPALPTMNLGKALAGVVLLGSAFAGPGRTGLGAAALAGVRWGLLASLMLVGPALLLGIIHPAPLPPIQHVLAFAMINLCTVCVAEEAFFRGLIQGWLCERLSHPQRHRLAIIVSALLFGAVHLPSGVGVAALAALSGLIHGVAYARSGHLAAPILSHLTINLVHRTFFT
jgi:membrane protease YdiL (CAAX protease family)